MSLLNLNPFGVSKKRKISEETKSKLALEYSSIGVWEYMADKNRVYFSDGSKQIIGVKSSDFGKNPNDWNDRIHPKDKARYFQDFQDHLNGLVPMYHSVHRVRCENGTYKWIRDRGKIVEWTKDGQYKRIIGTHTDITALKNAEFETINALDIATEQNNRLKNFAHIVTHNLKQHAANLESVLELHKDADSEEEKQDLFNHLSYLSTSLTKTIKDLKDVVSVQTNKNRKIKKLYLALEVERILKMLKTVIKGSKAKINNNIDRNLFIYYNPSYFESIVQNLLTNAIKYRHPDRTPVINLNSKFNSETIELEVSDNGLGIDLNKYGNDIFGLYRTFHSNTDAEGVGLYLIKNQIENFGGSIAVKSKVGEGTTFVITATNGKSIL